MKELLYLTFISALLAVGVFSADPTNETVTIPTTQAPKTTPTTEAPKTTPTTEAPKTTPTTEAPKTTPTTEAPKTTPTTPAPKTTPQPGPKLFVYKNCLALQADITILGKSSPETVPQNANITGSCGKNSSSLTLTWKESDSITFTFANRDGTVYLQDVAVMLANNSNKATVDMKLSDDKTYYECPTIPLRVGDFNVTLDGLKVQAFNYNTTFSGSGENCESTSSVAPSTTPVPATSTLAPTPSPKIPPIDNYTVSGVLNGTNVTCLVLQAAIKLKIPYEGKTKNLTYEGSIGSSPSYHGTCTNSTNTLKITSGAVTLDLIFTSTGSQYYLSDLKLTADAKKFKDGKDVQIKSNYTNSKKQNELKLGDSYSCRSKTTLQLSSDVEVDITNLKLAAFRTSNTSKIDSGKMVLCPQDQQTNSIVPIAVGAALAGLVVVVLIAYLIGRKRSRRGYESV